MTGGWKSGWVLAFLLSACAGTEAPAPSPAEPPAPEPVAAPEPPAGPVPSLLMVQAQFVNMKPGPARLNLQRFDGTNWFEEVIEDPDSNVFHKAIPWRDGILTIGAMKAMVKHWKKVDGQWTATTLVERSWGGKFDRFRDVETADVDGDGKEELILATHDMGVVSVGDEQEDGTWTFAEFDQRADTFVHEVEVGDVDGDGKAEFYVTPSERNKASGVSQPGGVARYDYDPGTQRYKRTSVVQWKNTHAKEITVADLDGDGVDELYAAREAVTSKGADGKLVIEEPAQIVQLRPEGSPANGPSAHLGWRNWTATPVATLPGEPMCRFLVAADVNHDRKKDLVAAGKETGLWMLDRQADGTFVPQIIDASSGGFEHATHVADFDFDGKVEIYAASEKADQRQLRRYFWDGSAWQKTPIADIPAGRITWNLQDGRF